MRTAALKYTALSWVSTIALIIILLMPFHAFLTVWLSSIFGHYTALRLWKELLLIVCALAALGLVAIDHKIRSHTLSRRLVWLILVYIFLNITWGLIALSGHDVSKKALGYGLISNLRFLTFFLVTWAVAVRLARLRVHWQWIILWPAGIVIIFGLLQALVLPHDFLSHFGYGSNTIPPFETINHNSHYLRFASTLRGPNPLGAYLLIPISLLTILLVRHKRPRLYGGLLTGALVVEFFSFSRSAWLGTISAIGIVLTASLTNARARRLIMLGAAGMVVLASLLGLALRNNARFENLVFHTEEHSKIVTSSNDSRAEALRRGADQVINEPLGRGPGTAGPASVYNHNHTPRIAENYYLQVGQETGWLGLAIFLLISAGVGALLWVRRGHPLALSLFAAFIGLTLINLLSHAWADDTVAYMWWGLAGIAMAPDLNKEE